MTDKYLSRLRASLKNSNISFDKDDLISSAVLLHDHCFKSFLLFSHWMDDRGAERLRDDARGFSTRVVSSFCLGKDDIFIGQSMFKG